MNEKVVSKSTFSDKEFHEINELLDICKHHDHTSLKLELEHKRRSFKNNSSENNEFMYYLDDRLVGYIGICNFGGPSIEVNGMVHPEYRRQGIYTKLFSLVINEWKKLGNTQMLLLSDHASVAGNLFIKSTGAVYDFAEYEMYLDMAVKNAVKSKVILRKATNDDALSIHNQNLLYFNDVHESDAVDDLEDLSMPEDEEKKGMHIYMAEVDGESIGKVNLIKTDLEGAIYGLGVLPDERRKGYGRQILLGSIDILKEMGSQEIMLQVVVENKKALNLYLDCGFKVTSTMNYYKMKK